MGDLRGRLEVGTELDESVADVDKISLGLALGLGSIAVLVLNAWDLIQLLKDQPLLITRTIDQHVLLQPDEPEPQPFSDDLGGGFEQGGSLLEIALALLQVELDIGPDSIGAQFL